MKPFNIAIDGPAGAGKSTIAKKIAKKLGIIYVDTGAMYRAMALYLMNLGISPEDKEAIEKASQDADISIEFQNKEQIVLLNGENVNDFLRTEAVGNMASISSANACVRRNLQELQYKLANKSNVIMDGRDIGTCVLPNADLKIYLTASSKERAKRRYLELTEKGISCDINEIEKDIVDRDQRDMTREISPLRQAEDAILIDSSNMTIDEVVETIISLFQKIKK